MRSSSLAASRVCLDQFSGVKYLLGIYLEFSGIVGKEKVVVAQLYVLKGEEVK